MKISAVLAKFRGMKKAKEPRDVFTPRGAKVNRSIYVERDVLEASLEEGLESSFHLWLRGASGCGKSWLYKKTLEDKQAFCLIGNLANASRFGSISELLGDLVQAPVKTGFRIGKEASAGIGSLSGGIKSEVSYDLRKIDPFRFVLEECRRRAGKAQAVLILDNLEAIVDKPELMRELANIVILIDDGRYEEYKVKLLLVGAVDDFLRHYSDNPSLQAAISNRLRSLVEVGRFSLEECRVLIETGLGQLNLKVPTEEMGWLVKHIAGITGGIPQRLHEYCLKLSRLAIAKRLPVDKSLVDEVDQLWSAPSGASIIHEEPRLNDLPVSDSGLRQQLDSQAEVGSPILSRSYMDATKLLLRSHIVSYSWKGVAYLFLVALVFYGGFCLYVWGVFN